MIAVVIGVGGLGCPSALVLARAGIALRLVDDDVVERSNLPRQILFSASDLGLRKVVAGAASLVREVPGVSVETVDARFTSATAAALLVGAGVMLDCTDRLETRFLANDVSFAAGVPLVHGAVLGWTGQVMPIAKNSRGAGCYRCLFEAPPAEGIVPRCAEAGVLGAACGAVGAKMASEALRLLAGDASGVGTLTTIDLRSGNVRRIDVPQENQCAACGTAVRAVA